MEFLKSAVTTVARYETSHPPRGKVLLRLADIANRHGLGELAQEFSFLYFDELLANLSLNLIVSNPADPNRQGYLVLKLEGQEQIDDALDLLHKQSGYKVGDNAVRDNLERALFRYTGKTQ